MNRRLFLPRLNLHHHASPRRAPAACDLLTGLQDRRWLQAQLDACLRQSAGRTAALLLLGLDDFRSVNESAGHDHGDALLVQFTRRLRDLLPADALLARMGGDEFCVGLRGCGLAMALEIGHAIMKTFTEPFYIEHTQRYSSCSIGVALAPDDSATAGKLVSRADMALHQAKRLGRGTMVRFDRSFTARVENQLEIQALLRGALCAGNQFSLYLQPQFHVETGHIVGLEALLRWTHPERGEISPNVFIPAAEAGGLIGIIGDWVLEEACRLAKVLRDAGRPIRIAINLSALQLRKRDLVERVGAALAQYGLPPEAIEIELTESCLVEDAVNAAETIARLSALGIQTTIDDFGTGFSSLSYLCALPVRAIKIDRSFVQQMEVSEKNVRVVRGLIQLAHGLELSVLAEGVETRWQLRQLNQLGCDSFQGWLASKALPLPELLGYLKQQEQA